MNEQERVLEGRTLSLRVVEEDLDTVDMLGSGERITPDTKAKGLAKADTGGLGDSLIRKGSRARNDT